MQEVINRDNWKPGQAVDFLIGHMSGTGVRWVQSAHDSYATALHFEYLYWSGSSWVVPSVDSPTEIQGLVAADTAEENTADGSMYTTSTDLELMHDSAEQVVGLRFAGVEIPGPSDSGYSGPQTVVSASIELTVDELCVRGQSCANGQTAYSDQPVTIAIWAEAADNSVAITENAQVGAHWDERAENTEVPFELSAREPTAAAVMWQPESSAAVGDKLTTPDLAHLVQEVVQRPGWTSGNALTFLLGHVSGSGVRWVESGSGPGGAAAAPALSFSFGEGSLFQHAEPQGDYPRDCPGTWNFVLAGTGYTHSCKLRVGSSS